MPVLLRIALTGLIAVLLQWIVLGRLRLWGAYPDGVLIFIAWLGFAYGRRTGAVYEQDHAIGTEAFDDTFDHRRANGTGADSIHTNAGSRVLQRDRARQLNYATLGCRVGRPSRNANQPCD